MGSKCPEKKPQYDVLLYRGACLPIALYGQQRVAHRVCRAQTPAQEEIQHVILDGDNR
jgi:hypothetical protein